MKIEVKIRPLLAKSLGVVCTCGTALVTGAGATASCPVCGSVWVVSAMRIVGPRKVAA